MLNASEKGIGMVQNANGVFLTPSDAAMTEAALTAWLRERGVEDAGYLAELVAEYRGLSEAQMDAIYSDMHS